MGGQSESPPNASPAAGFGRVTYHDSSHTIELISIAYGLLGGSTSSELHAPTATGFAGTAGVAIPLIGYPYGSLSPGYDNSFDLTQPSTWDPTYLSANGGTPSSAEAAFVTALTSGKMYWEIHTSAFPNGEIRGFMQLETPEQPAAPWYSLALSRSAA
jgi:hypothetical protein